jgi:hypothetical protein
MSKGLFSFRDWLPPEVGAVRQYAMLETRPWARRGFRSVMLDSANRGVARDERKFIEAHAHAQAIPHPMLTL